MTALLALALCSAAYAGDRPVPPSTVGVGEGRDGRVGRTAEVEEASGEATGDTGEGAEQGATGSSLAAAAALAPGRWKPFLGSYGRVQASTDPFGGRGSGVQVTRYGPRLQLGPYLELDVGWDAVLPSGAEVTVLVTPGVSGDVFHYDGTFQDDIALRNLYAEIRGLGGGDLSAWAGSRMYRGDDIYLLDFWPLDNLNTLGGGVAWSPGRSQIAAHVGVNRLSRGDWQVQDALVADPGGIAGERVLVLDRQRTIASLRGEHRVLLGELTLRLKAYGEVHALPAGERLVDDTDGTRIPQALPSDHGTLAGVQVSLWGWATQSFVHVWARHATGLAATGELVVPMDGFDTDLRVASSRSTLLAVTGNSEHGVWGLQWAAYVDVRADADGQRVDFDDRVDAVGVLRPNLWIGQHGALSLEFSHQLVRPNGLNPRTSAFDVAHVTQVSLVPALQVAPGAYTRPRLQVVGTLTRLSDGARRFFNPEDVRSQQRTQLYVGLGAEWWIDSRRVVVPE
jgi:hypothetical protein